MACIASTGELQSVQNSGRCGGISLGSVEKGVPQRARLTGANKRMFNLLRKAKVQLIKIDQQKQLKSSGVRSPSPQACIQFIVYIDCLLVA